ncbi:MAG TPA: ABC transporter substrate-binding protein [Thermosipho africanus]|jgi:lactose/L-arabinose transport system substrate-binding protein|nr:ABC transporter substrate-binding protein [Thermosipho africanus]
MRKVLFVLLILSVLVSLGVAAKVTIWCWDPNFNVAIMQEAAERYKAMHPDVEFEIVSMAKADVEQKLNTILASGVKKGLPEIVLIEDYNAQKYLQSYPGSFADLTKKFNFKEFSPYKVKLMTLNGKVYGVPFDSGVAGWFYRRDYFKEAGIDESELRNITWDKFIELGKIVKEKTGKYMMAGDPYDGGLMRILLQSAGSWYFDKNGKPFIKDNPVLKEAVRLYKEIQDSGISKEVSGWNEWVAAFNNGDVASVITGVWIVGSIKAEKSQSGKWGVLPIPRLNLPGAVNASNLGGSSWYVLEHSENKDVAIDFLREIYAKDVDFYQKILIERGAVGSWIPAQNGPAYREPDPFFGYQRIYLDFTDWMDKIPPVDYGIFTYEADAALMGVMPDVYNGNLTIEKALEMAEKQFLNTIGY